MNILYPKIQGPYKRFVDGPNKHQLDIGNWSSDEFRALAKVPWTWTEKIDGTNIRILWDGYNVTFGGRTNDAQINASLFDFLKKKFTEEIFEQVFQNKGVILFGEGFGAGINNGGRYGENKSFALFDVTVTDPSHPLGVWWLKPSDVFNIAISVGAETVPDLGEFDLITAIDAVSDGLQSQWGGFVAEGMVGKPVGGLINRRGERIAVKVKTKDFINE